MSDAVMVEELAAGPTVGERLRSARAAQGLELEEIAARTRIPTRHLQMIERGDYAGLPAVTYSAGFIKTYARLLGLDGQALSDEFRAELTRENAVPTQTLPYEPADPRRTPPAGLALLALLVAIVAGIGFLYWRGSADQPIEVAAAGGDAPVSAPPAAAPSSAPPPSPSAALPVAPVASGPVAIGATQDVWIKVSDGGRTLYLGVLKVGDRYEVPADAAAPLLTTGRPGATAITVGETAIPTVGDPDRAAKDVSLKPADLLARMSVQPSSHAPAPVDAAAGPA